MEKEVETIKGDRETVVISLGGSLIVPDSIDTEFLERFRDLMISMDKRFIIVAGGGRTCRLYNEAALSLTKPSTLDLDTMGIVSTKLNAELVRIIFEEYAYEHVIENPTLEIKTDKKVLIGAGWKPGCSSDMDAVLLAKTFGATTVINLSNIDYVYDSDPKLNSDAKPLHKISWEAFKELVGDWESGKNVPFDPTAAKEAESSRIRVVILNGKDLENLRNFLEGKEFKGSVVE